MLGIVWIVLPSRDNVVATKEFLLVVRCLVDSHRCKVDLHLLLVVLSKSWRKKNRSMQEDRTSKKKRNYSVAVARIQLSRSWNSNQIGFLFSRLIEVRESRTIRTCRRSFALLFWWNEFGDENFSISNEMRSIDENTIHVVIVLKRKGIILFDWNATLVRLLSQLENRWNRIHSRTSLFFRTVRNKVGSNWFRVWNSLEWPVGWWRSIVPESSLSNEAELVWRIFLRRWSCGDDWRGNGTCNESSRMSRMRSNDKSFRLTNRN